MRTASEKHSSLFCGGISDTKKEFLNAYFRLDEYFENLLKKSESLKNKIALIDPKVSLTFGQLNSAANKVAKALIRELQVEQGGHVLVAVWFEPGNQLTNSKQ